MAKLSAYGRTELARFSKEEGKPNQGSPDDVSKERLLFAFMSDGTILQQLKIWWVNGQVHLYPWKRVCKVGLDKFTELQANLAKKGYVKL